MDASQLRRVVVELGARFGLTEFFVVGSSAVFASLPTVSAGALTATRDVDIALPSRVRAKLSQIEFVMGEGSAFDDEHGFYVQTVDLETPRYAPAGWMERTERLTIGQTTARCMELHDLALAKYGAGREKDLEFNQALVALGAVDRSVLLERLPAVDTTPEHRDLIAARIARDFRS